jgi:tRNA nucleotidyltransferase/poly(A) polymerase
MNLRQLLDLLKKISESNGISTPYVCGGVARDKAMNQLGNTIADLDITNGDKSIHNLAKEFIIELKKQFNVLSKVSDDGHTSVYAGNLKIDFSSNFISPSIDQELNKLGIKNASNLLKEVYSRDFTCNSLLLDFDLKTLKDLTDRGIEDINSKVIKTCLDPDITLKDNTKRIIRLLYLSAKLDFDIDPILIQWVLKNKDLITTVDAEYLAKNLNKGLELNPDRAIDFVKKTDIWNLLPATDLFKPYLKNNMQKTSQLFTNYDLYDNPTGPGSGIYSNLDKYKSVSEFRKKRRKRRKKVIDRIKKMKMV